jgi:hypothetical protein
MKLPFFGKKESDEILPDARPARPFTITLGRGGGGAASQPSGGGASYGLTPLGKQKILQLDETDDRFQILAAIQEYGPSSCSEISERVHRSVVKVNYLINGRDGLVGAGCLKKVGQGGE